MQIDLAKPKVAVNFGNDPVLILNGRFYTFLHALTQKLRPHKKTVFEFVGGGKVIPQKSFPVSYQIEWLSDRCLRLHGKYKFPAGTFLTNANLTPRSSRIETPFASLIAGAFEISIHQTFFHSVLTVHASGYLQNGTLFLAVGRSGSGKSTFLKRQLKLDGQRIAIGDDHVAIRVSSDRVSVFCPAWDKFFNGKGGEKDISAICIISCDSEHGPLSHDLATRTVGFGFDGNISNVIDELWQKIAHKIHVYHLSKRLLETSNPNPPNLDAESFVSLVSELLAEGMICELPFNGTSMAPTIFKGSTVFVRKHESIEENKIYLFKCDQQPEGLRLVAHRCIKSTKGALRFKGDNRSTEEIIAPHQLIGEVYQWTTSNVPR